MADTPTSAETLRAKNTPPPVDPNLNLPRAVREAGKRAEIVQQALVGQAEPSIAQPPTEQGAPTPPQAPPALPPSAPPTPPAAAAPPQPEPEVPPEEWRNRFLAMQGRFQRAEQMMAQMGDQVHHLQSENASLRSTTAPAQPLPQGTLLTEDEMRDYGPEFIDVVRRAATEIAAPLHAQIQDLQGRLGHVQQETGNAFLTRMNATVGGLIPNWQDLNRDPRFVQWVQLPDIYSGVMRQQLMQDAWNSGDAHRVAAFFRAFLAEEAAVDPRASARPPQQPQPASPQPGIPPAVPGVPLGTRLSLDQLAAPGRAQSSAQMPADKPMYTAQDITRFYTECAAGKWRTREAERAAIDADIIAAQHEGRIIPDQRSIRPMDWNGNR
jgi:hypothetical protein